MEDPRIISALFIFLKMAYYNVLINSFFMEGMSEPEQMEYCCDCGQRIAKDWSE